MNMLASIDREQQRRKDLTAALDRTPAMVLQRAVVEASKHERKEADPARLAVTARHIGEIIATPTTVRWLIRDVLERSVIALLAGKRGSFKSFIAMDWALRTALDGGDVLLISAEGAGLDRRFLAALKTHAPDTDPKSLPFYAIERRIDFNSADGIAAVLEEINRLGIKPVLIIIDTLSKNSGGLDENDNREVKQFIGGLDSNIRRPLDATILIVAHTGHGDQSRARGASALEADTDAAYIVTKASDELVTVSRERFKDNAELSPLAYSVAVVELDHTDDLGQPVTSCALIATESTMEAAKPELRGKAQRQLLAALRATDSKGPWTLAAIREIAKKAGMSKSTARYATEGLAFSPFMVASVGGYRLAND